MYDCGSIGCYEMYGSTETALVKNAMALDPKYDTGRKIFEGLVSKGIRRLEKVLSDWVDQVAWGLCISHTYL